MPGITCQGPTHVEKSLGAHAHGRNTPAGTFSPRHPAEEQAHGLPALTPGGNTWNGWSTSQVWSSARASQKVSRRALITHLDDLGRGSLSFQEGKRFLDRHSNTIVLTPQSPHDDAERLSTRRWPSCPTKYKGTQEPPLASVPKVKDAASAQSSSLGGQRPVDPHPPQPGAGADHRAARPPPP